MQVDTIHEQLFFTTAFIETLDQGGQTGSGTGFIYGVETGPGQTATFLVTNKHVIANASSATVRFIASDTEAMVQPSLGTTRSLVIDRPEQLFTGHPVPQIDVAVLPLTPFVIQMQAQGAYPFFKTLPASLALTDVNVQELDAIEDVTFVGYPNGLFDSKHFLPILRTGTAATPLSVDYGGEPIFLVDASVFPGSSGSPVLLIQKTGYVTRNGGAVFGSPRVFLLGVVAAAYQRQVPVLQTSTAGGTAFVNDLLNIGIVYKAKAIDEVVDLILARHGLHRHNAHAGTTIMDARPDSDPLAGTPIG